MTIELPSELVSALSFLGFDWPDADEDKLDGMGKAWATFSGTLRNLVDESDRHAQAVWTGNAGAAIAAFQKSWTGPSAPMTNLRDGADAAALIAVGLSTAAKIVVNRDEILKYGDTTILDAMKRLPGVTVVPGTRGGWRRAMSLRNRSIGSELSLRIWATICRPRFQVVITR